MQIDPGRCARLLAAATDADATLSLPGDARAVIGEAVGGLSKLPAKEVATV